MWKADIVKITIICANFFRNPAGNYMFKVNNRNSRTKVWNMFKVNNKDTKTTPLLTLNIFHTFVLVFLLLTLSR